MKLIRELARISEAEEQKDVDVVDIVKNFPSNHKKAIKILWGQERLTFNGLSFFGKGGIYDQLPKAVSQFCNSRSYSGIGVYVDFGEYADNEIYVDYADTTDPEKVGQEVYMGYNPTSGELIVGYDTSLDEEVFNEEFEKQWKKTYNTPHDYDDPKQAKAYNVGWKEWQELRPYVAFSLTVENNVVKVKDEEAQDTDSFYSGGLHDLRNSMRSLINLRLD